MRPQWLRRFRPDPAATEEAEGMLRQAKEQRAEHEHKREEEEQVGRRSSRMRERNNFSAAFDAILRDRRA